MDMDKLREYVRLRRAQKDKEAQASADKEAADQLEQELLEMFAENSIQNMNVDGMTVYLQRSVRAQVDPAYEQTQVVERLTDAGLDHFVKPTYNMNTLSSYLRDLEREGEDLPEPLQGVLRPFEQYQLRTRRS